MVALVKFTFGTIANIGKLGLDLFLVFFC